MTTGTTNTNEYIELLKKFPPRPISSDEKLLATQKVIDSLIDKGELTSNEQYYLNVLGTLVYEYTQLHHEPIPDIVGADLIEVLLIEYNLQPKDLISIFGNESIVSEVLSGQRQLTENQIHQLADFFNMSPDDFRE